MFCNYCGHTNPDDGAFCSKCGKHLNPAEQQSTSPYAKYKVTIFRESQTYLLNPPINVTVDNKNNYSIANGKTLELALGAGQHDITFSQSMRKKAVRVNLSGNVSIRLRWNRLTGAIEAAVS